MDKLDGEDKIGVILKRFIKISQVTSRIEVRY